MSTLNSGSISELQGNSQFLLIGAVLYIISNTDDTGTFTIYSSLDYGITVTQVATYTFTPSSLDVPFDPACCTDGTYLYILGTRVNPSNVKNLDIVWFRFDPSGPTLTGPVASISNLIIGSDYDILAIGGGSSYAVICSFSVDDAFAEQINGYSINASGVATLIVPPIASSPARGGQTYDSISLLTGGGALYELYVTSHPKAITFSDYTMTLAVYESLDAGGMWGAATTLLTLPVRHVSSDLTVTFNGNARWLSTTYYTQNRAGLSGNILLGFLADITNISTVPWSFNQFTGTPKASLVEGSINVFSDNSTVFGFITRDLTRNPAVDGIVSVNTLTVANWQYIANPAFRNPNPTASWLRGTKSILPLIARWGFLAEQRVAPGNATFYSGFLVPPVAAVSPVAINPAARNASYLFDASGSFDLNFNPLEYEWNLQISVGVPFPAWQMSHVYSVGNEILDGNGNVQIAMTSGMSGSIEPLSQWQPKTVYTFGEQVVDSNGFVQQVTQAGTSGTVTPTWNPRQFGTTGDGSVIWANESVADDFWSTQTNGLTVDNTVIWATAITLVPNGPPNTQSTTAVVAIGDVIGPSAQNFQVQVGVIDLDPSNNPIHTPPVGAAQAQAALSLPLLPPAEIQWLGNFVNAPLWAPNTHYPLGFVIYDGSHMQEATTAGTSGVSNGFGYSFGASFGNSVSFNHSGGTTVDGTVIWTDLGAALSGPGFGYDFGMIFDIGDTGTISVGRNSTYVLTPTITPGQVGIPLTYAWSQIAGTPVKIGPTFGPTLTISTNGVDLNTPLVDGLIFQIVVSDGVNFPVISVVTLNVVPYIFNIADSLVLARSNWVVAEDFTKEAHSVPAVAPYFVTVSNPPAADQIFVDGGVNYTGGAALVLVVTPPLVGEYNVDSIGKYAFSAADAAATIQTTYSLTEQATISQRNTAQFWTPLVKSGIYTDQTNFKRSTNLTGEERFTVISPASVLVYGDMELSEDSILLRKLLIPDTDSGTIQDAVHTELDYTIVLTTTGNLYRYSTVPLVSTDSPDAMLVLSDFVTLTLPIPPIWQADAPYGLGDEILDSNGNIQIVIQTGVSSGFGFGSNFGVSFTTQPAWNMVLGGVTNDGPSLVWKNIGIPVIFDSVFSTPTFADVRVIALSGPSGCFLMQLDSATFAVQGFFEISVASGLVYGADNVQWIRESNIESLHSGQVLLGTLDSQGRTFETLIDLRHRLVIGTWDASKLKNQFVTTGEILFAAESSYVGLPVPPVMQPPVVNPDNSVSLAWTDERPDLVSSYSLFMSVNGGASSPLTFIGSGTVESFRTTSLVAGNTYTFKVQSNSPDGLSVFSNSVSAYIGAPNPPFFLQIVQVSDPGGPFSVTLDWSIHAPGAEAVASYTLQMSTISVFPLEAHQVPAIAPFAVQVAHPPEAGNSFLDGGVFYAATGIRLTPVASNPGPGQYTVSATGLYKFNLADSGLGLGYGFGEAFGESTENILITYSVSTPFTTIAVVQGGSTQTYTVTGLAGQEVYNFRIAATYNTNLITPYSGVVYIGLPLQVPAQILPQAFWGVPYSAQLQAGVLMLNFLGDENFILYGVPPYVWDPVLLGGALPMGLSISPEGVISGIPMSGGFGPNFGVSFEDGGDGFGYSFGASFGDSDAGIYTFTVQVTDSALPSPETGESNPGFGLVFGNDFGREDAPLTIVFNT